MLHTDFWFHWYYNNTICRVITMFLLETVTAQHFVRSATKDKRLRVKVFIHSFTLVTLFPAGLSHVHQGASMFKVEHSD